MPDFDLFSCRPCPCCTGGSTPSDRRLTSHAGVEEEDAEREELELEGGRSSGLRFARTEETSRSMPRVPSTMRRSRTMKSKLSIERVHS